jgi:pimeloyl-ACP methyl ester carboxylesterase
LILEIGSNATLEIVKNSGHTPHLEQPKVFNELLSDFLSK